MSSHSIRSDSVYFLHQSNHTDSDVKFHTSNNFDMMKPVKCKEYILNEKFKIIESGDSFVVQKKVGDAFVTKFTVE